jgi:hypothetical protein
LKIEAIYEVSQASIKLARATAWASHDVGKRGITKLVSSQQVPRLGQAIKPRLRQSMLASKRLLDWDIFRWQHRSISFFLNEYKERRHY